MIAIYTRDGTLIGTSYEMSKALIEKFILQGYVPINLKHKICPACGQITPCKKEEEERANNL